MKYCIIIALAALATGCTSTKIPGVMDASNFGFNQSFSKFSASSTNGTVVSAEGFVSEATENLKVFMDGLTRSISAAVSGGATAMFQQQPFLMVPAPVGGVDGPARALGSPPGPQIIYLVPMGRTHTAPVIIQAPVPPHLPVPPELQQHQQ